jgi:hypothetical protein
MKIKVSKKSVIYSLSGASVGIHENPLQLTEENYDIYIYIYIYI